MAVPDSTEKVQVDILAHGYGAIIGSKIAQQLPAKLNNRLLVKKFLGKYSGFN